jgi:hypothetical protein
MAEVPTIGGLNAYWALLVAVAVPALVLLGRVSPHVRLRVLVGVVSFVILVSYLDGGEFIEHKFVKSKGSPIHELLTSSSRYISPVWKPELLVFQHIPRTTGVTIILALIGHTDLTWIPQWPHEWSALAYALVPYFTPERLAREDTQTLVREATLIHGFFGREDLLPLARIRPTLTFTILREPIERALSFKALGNSQNDVCEYFTMQHPFPSTYTRNSMTWQLGYYARTENRSISEVEVLKRAKKQLTGMAFMGFYEDLLFDFPRLWREVFPHYKVPWIFPAIFMLGTLIGYPRLKTAKYAAALTVEELACVRQANLLDIQLYAWARMHAGREVDTAKFMSVPS